MPGEGPPAHESGAPRAVKVSVVIPTRNRAALLERAVRSALAQTFRDFEVIVADDGSTDGTGDRLRAAFAPELASGILRCHRNERRMERSATRNLGVSLARGEWIALLDDDDFFLPFHLQTLHGAAEAHPETDFLNSEGFTIDPDNRITFDPTGLPTRFPGEPSELPFTTGILWGSTTLFRKRMFDELGGFRKDLDFGEDRELFWRAARTHVYGFVAIPTICRMVHPGSHLLQASPDHLAQSQLKFIRTVEGHARRQRFRLPAKVRGALWLRAAELLLHRPSRSRAALLRALRHDPRLLFGPVGRGLALRLFAGDAPYRLLKRFFGGRGD